MGAIKKIVYHIIRPILVWLSYVDHRAYMKAYVPMLKFMGMRFNGVPRYIGKDVKFDVISQVTLGDRVVISNECFFLVHDYSITTALIAINETPSSDVQVIKGIVVGNNVFIGKRSIIMPGSVLEDHVIVGAGSVVRGRIPRNSVVLGNPCQIIGKTTDQAYKWKANITSDMLQYD